MTVWRKIRKERSQRGVALIIALFALMLISVIAMSVVLMAGTETALKGNYKAAMQAFYDAKAGLEEARGRLWTMSPNSISSKLPVPLDEKTVLYIVNPSSGETVNPVDSTNPFYDSQYSKEWPGTVANVLQPLISSTSATGGIAGPLYKWVRITAATDSSLHPTGTGTVRLFYDNTGHVLDSGGPEFQVLTITALAVTPYGSRRIMQYTVAKSPAAVNQLFASGGGAMPTVAQIFPAALTLGGPSPTFGPASSNSFLTNGNDGSGPNASACPAAAPAVSAIAASSTGDATTVTTAIGSQKTYYTGKDAAPSVSSTYGLLPASEQDVKGLEGVAQNVTNVATEVVIGPASTLPNTGSAASPVTAVVQGDLTLTDVTGYGVLLVTGKLTLSGTAGWRGVVLVIGKGEIGGNAITGNEFDGALLVAKTRDASGSVLANLGSPVVNWGSAKGNGIYYNTCWINKAASALPYQVLSFREISE
jgi:hypothetical protein